MDRTVFRLRVRSILIAVIIFSMLSGSSYAAGEWCLALSSGPDGCVIRICKECQGGDLVFGRLRKVAQKDLALKPLRGSEVRVATLQQFVKAMQKHVFACVARWKCRLTGIRCSPEALAEDLSSTPEAVRKALTAGFLVRDPARN